MEYDIKDKHFITKSFGGCSPCIQGNDAAGLRPFPGSVLPNCVGAATAVANIKAGYDDDCKYLGNRNAVDFVDFVKLQGLDWGMAPKEGACMVWGHGEGHVAVVDKVISDTEVETVESGWSYRAQPVLRRIRRKKGDNGRWGYAHDFLMFIYIPKAQPDPGPDPKPDTYYIVVRGDNLTKIARKFGVTVSDLVRWNNIKNPNLIYPGQKLLIREPEGVYYTVVRGDNLTKIARMYDTTVSAILALNPNIKNPNLILVGQVIRVK